MSDLTKRDGQYMRLAEVIAEPSKCLRAKYGAVIVSRDDRVVGTGFNGKPRGSLCDDICFREGVPEADRTHECCLHAERNAIMFTTPQEREGGTLYVTGIPCKTCALHIMQSGIRRLVYLIYSHSDSGKRVSDDAFWEAYGVEIERVAFTWADYNERFKEAA